MKEFITKFLDSKGITWKEQDGKIVISDEFQEEEYILTEHNYPHSLNTELSEFNEVLDNEYGFIFECEWAGTFGICLS